MEKKEFEVELPKGKRVKSTDLNETQYKDACELQILQSQINELAKNVSEFHLKKDHFELIQKRLIDSLDKEDG